MIIKAKVLRWLYGLLASITLIFLATIIWSKIDHYYGHKDSTSNPGFYPGEVYKLSGNELVSNKALAEKGDVKAMHNLWLYYGVYMDTEESLKDFNYWGEKITAKAKAGDLEARKIFSDWQERTNSED